MPRCRPRKPRLSRMDAAVDAMSQYGFAEQRVRKHVKELLKEYGGDEAWPFIEDCSYKELIEAILREPEMDLQVVHNGDQIMDNSCGNEEPTPPVSQITHDGESWKDILPDQTSGNIKETDNLASENHQVSSTNSGTLALPPPDSVHSTNTHTHLHCYGWIESDEDDDNEFIHLQLKPGVFGPKPNMPREHSKCVNDVAIKRKSRWDERPAGDP